MPGEPLIFVEVALTRGIATSIQDVLRADRTTIAAEDATTAVFYSISNCQPGLKGISFGHFLIKQVAADLQRMLPKLSSFATLSPLPGFAAYLQNKGDKALRAMLDRPDWWKGAATAPLRARLEAHAIAYLTEAKAADGKSRDPVARFTSATVPGWNASTGLPTPSPRAYGRALG